MPFEEKRAWSVAGVSICAYAVYVAVLLQRAEHAPLSSVSYVSVLLWTMGLAIAAGAAFHVGFAVAARSDAHRTDERDREIHRFGEVTGQGFVVVGALAALGLALAAANHFWIANVIYLAFVLSAVVGSAAKIVAYRRGL